VILGFVIGVVVVALAFQYTNGFHDAATAIAAAVSTQAMTPRLALGIAALMNLAGALAGTGVAVTVAKGIIDVPRGGHGLTVILAAVLGAIVWNLVTWYFGLPSSSTHSLIGGMVGAALASLGHVYWLSGVVGEVVVPMVVSPIIGLGLAYVAMVVILWVFRRRNPHRVQRGFRYSQLVSASSLALGHGLQDAQKTMGIIVLVLYTVGYRHGFSVPLWVVFVSAVTLSAGTYAGGWRIIRTMGRRIVKLDSPRGFAAEAMASAVLYVTALVFTAPVSSTHVITGAIAGAGATRGRAAVRWGVAGNIVVAWILTLPAAACSAAAIYGIVYGLSSV
jgi:PiT family inorganic phosphate transporter